ncbi:MAG TPA: CvpA family protein [Candidatus Limnocylindria bacterium]|jgi:hypothetical protein|nr:CvpA family protein [Candidatus Limnocylindria bacterium]
MEFIAQFTIADLVVLLTLAGGVLVGFQQGLLRYILNCIVVLVAFVLASVLKGPIADSLSGVWHLGTPDEQELWIYITLMAVGVIGGFLLVRTLYGKQRLPLVRQVDEVLGAVMGVLFVALIYTFSWVVLASFFQLAGEASVESAGILGSIYDILNDSFILGWFREWLLPIAGFVVRPFVPEEIAAFLTF